MGTGGTESDSWEVISSLVLGGDFHHHPALKKFHSRLVGHQVEKEKLKTFNLELGKKGDIHYLPHRER